MTHEEAVKKLKANEERRIQLTYFVIKDMAIKALEKQIPKKPKVAGKNYFVCPCCETQIPTPFYKVEANKYCLCCGQALYWGDNDGKEG